MLTGVGSVLSTVFDLVFKLHEPVRKYKQKKETESRFMSAFENEIEKFLDVYGRAVQLSEKEVLPLLQTVQGEITPHDVNALLEAMMPIPLMYAEWIEAFVSFAKACSEVSAIKGFMDYLRESNIVLYDFVDMMKDTYVRDQRKVVIDARYYRFFKLYQNDIFGKVKQSELDLMTERLAPYVEKISSFVKRVRQLATRTALIKRSIRKRYVRNYRIFVKASGDMIVEKTSIIDLRAYAPKGLLPATIFIEELSLS